MDLFYSLLMTAVYFSSFVAYFIYNYKGFTYSLYIDKIFRYLFFSLFIVVFFYKLLGYLKNRLIAVPLVIVLTPLNYILALKLRELGDTGLLLFFQFSAPIITSVFLGVILYVIVTKLGKRGSNNE